MKKQSVFLIGIFLMFSLSHPTTGYAKPIDIINECMVKHREKQAPCTVEIFSNSMIDLRHSFDIAVSATDLNRVVTCGVKIKNGAGSLVATLSETVYARWNWTTHYVDNAIKYYWSASLYGWINLSGPTPNTGWGQFQSPVEVVTSGRNTWPLGAPIAHRVQTTINGTLHNPQWDCAGSY